MINVGWAQQGMANVSLARRTPRGISHVAFLVDLYGVGLKDVAVHTGLSRQGLDRLHSVGFGESGHEECTLPMAQDLVYGGVAWARRHGFRTPPEALRHLPYLPAPEAPPDLSRFGGEDGKPLLIMGLEDMARFLPSGPAGDGAG